MTARPLVVHVVNSLETGGLENGVVNLVNNASPRLRHAVVCMTVEGSFRSRLKAEVECLALHKQPGRDMRAFARLTMLLWKLRPTIVHSRNWATFDAVLAARAARIPAVVHGEHGRDISDPTGANWRRNRLRWAFAPWIDRYVTVSQDLNRWLVEKVRIPARKVTTIYNGVDLRRFGTAERSEARRRAGLPAHRLLVGTVGRLDPVKDHVGLVKAFAVVRAARPSALLMIVGDGPARMELDRLIRRLDLGQDALLLGDRQDIPELIAALDVFVLPSIAEGLSNTILEAMATGLPVVATRVGGNPELVEEGINGRLVPPRDTTALAGAIDAYLDDGHLRALHGKASRRRAMEEFDLPAMARAYEDLYEAVASGRSNRSA